MLQLFNMRAVSLLTTLLCLLSLPVWAKREYTVYISGEAYTKDIRVSPCFPLTAEFYHPNKAVTRIRMEYPIDPSKFFILSIQDESHLEFHEEVMRNGENPYIDFIAEDDVGNQYGRIRMLFYAPEDPDDNECRAFPNS